MLGRATEGPYSGTVLQQGPWEAGFVVTMCWGAPGPHRGEIGWFE